MGYLSENPHSIIFGNQISEVVSLEEFPQPIENEENQNDLEYEEARTLHEEL